MALLRVIDWETTGLEPPAEVIESGFTDFNPKDGSISKWGSSFHNVKSNPPETRSIHHIRSSDLDGKTAFDPEDFVRSAIAAGAGGFVAHNAGFEKQWIQRQIEGVIPLVCTYKAALRHWPDAPTHSNFGLFYWLEDLGKIEFDPALTMPAHRAGPDSFATAHILKVLYAEGVTGPDLVRWTREPKLLPTCPIGKFRGDPWGDVEFGFLTWMIRQPDMEEDYKWNAQREIDRRNSN